MTRLTVVWKEQRPGEGTPGRCRREREIVLTATHFNPLYRAVGSLDK